MFTIHQNNYITIDNLLSNHTNVNLLKWDDTLLSDSKCEAKQWDEKTLTKQKQ